MIRCSGRPRGSGKRGAVLAGVLVAGTVVGSAPGSAPGMRAQEGPPGSRPLEELELPPFEERRLSNGASLLVVPQHEQPFVTVHLVLPGGRTADPPDRVGLADATATLLTRGTEGRTASDIAGMLDFRGAELEASASTDWTTVTANAVTIHLPAVLELMADIVLHPTFPAEEVDRVRSDMEDELRATLERPSAVADREFARRVYGEHPYGRLPTAATVGAIERTAVVAFHQRWYRPGEALFVMAGDAGVDEAVELLEEAFGAWSPGPTGEVRYGLPPLRHAPEVVLVHRPGDARAVLRVGHSVARGARPEWTALSTLGQVLGGGPRARLPRILREEVGPEATAWVQAQRRRDRGYFRVAAEAPVDHTVPVLETLLAELLRVRREPVSIVELRDARDFLVGAFPLRIETPQQLASQLTAARLLGLPDSTLAASGQRIARLDPGDLRETAEALIQPDELVLVVVGDAARLRRPLSRFGDVTVVDVRGVPVDVADLPSPARPALLDAAGLEPTTLDYRVRVGDRTVGTVTRRLEPGDRAGTMVYRGTADLGPQAVDQSVTFTASGFEPVSARSRIGLAGGTVSMEAEVRDGRVVGTVRGPAPGTEERIDRAMPPGAVLGDMADLVVWMAELSEGEELEILLMQAETGALGTVRYHVRGVEEITVPAGTFRTWRVDVTGPEPATVWARLEAPHLPVRIEPTVGPGVLELVSSGAGGR